jgi:hypothetical protein
MKDLRACMPPAGALGRQTAAQQRVHRKVAAPRSRGLASSHTALDFERLAALVAAHRRLTSPRQAREALRSNDALKRRGQSTHGSAHWRAS